MVMTAVTVVAAYVDLGAMNTVVALVIASFKATLVVLYFMHVRHASRLTKLIVVTGLFFLAILLSETMMDYASRMWVTLRRCFSNEIGHGALSREQRPAEAARLRRP